MVEKYGDSEALDVDAERERCDFCDSVETVYLDIEENSWKK